MMRRFAFTAVLLAAAWYFAGGRAFLPVLAPGASSAEARLKTPLVLEEVKAAPEYDPEELTNIGVYKRLLPSVVNITATTVEVDFFYGAVPQQGQGSGFILDRQGHIATNYHVVADAQTVEVQTADKRRYKAQVIGKDRRHDIALLQIEGAQNLQPVALAESRSLVPGQKVYAIGNPFGLNGTMTTGIISAIRSIRGPLGGQIENAIQTDAAINPGNSGGPLLNSRGEVIGINTLIATNPNQSVDQSAGIGFAIPIDTARAVLADFQRYGHARRPSLGAVTLPIGPELAEQIGVGASSGLLLQQVTPGGAAQQAGLRGGQERALLGYTQIVLGGDLVVAVDGEPVNSAQDLADIMDRHQVGDTVPVAFYRGKRKMSVRVTLGEAGERSQQA